MGRNIKYVIAGSDAQATEWARRNGVKDWRYVYGPSQVYGLRNVELVAVGTYRLRYDYDQLRAICATRGIRIVEPA